MTGGCLCGEIRYVITAEPRATTFCHCRSCRLATGAPAVAWVVLRRGELTFERGTPTAFRSSPHVERTFCGRCGTSLTYYRDDYPDAIDVLTATIDAPDPFPPTREIWLDEKLAWMVSNDELERFRQSSRGAAPLPRARP
jgi:hypothetical protein